MCNSTEKHYSFHSTLNKTFMFSYSYQAISYENYQQVQRSLEPMVQQFEFS